MLSGRRALVAVLLVLGCMAVLLANVAWWARAFAYDESAFVDALEPLATDEELVDGIAVELVERIMSVQPGDDGTVRSVVDGAVHEVLSSSEFRTIWSEALKVAHQQLVRFVDDGNRVALDLDDVLTEVDALVSKEGRDILSGATIERIDDIVVTTEDRLDLVLTIVDTVERLAVVLPFVALGLFLAALVWAPSRRRTLAWIGFGVALAMVATVGVLWLLRLDVLGRIDDGVYRRAAEQVWEGVTESLLWQTAVVFGAGLAVGAGAWLVGAFGRRSPGGQPARPARSPASA